MGSSGGELGWLDWIGLEWVGFGCGGEGFGALLIQDFSSGVS